MKGRGRWRWRYFTISEKNKNSLNSALQHTKKRILRKLSNLCFFYNFWNEWKVEVLLEELATLKKNFGTVMQIFHHDCKTLLFVFFFFSGKNWEKGEGRWPLDQSTLTPKTEQSIGTIKIISSWFRQVDAIREIEQFRYPRTIPSIFKPTIYQSILTSTSVNMQLTLTRNITRSNFTSKSAINPFDTKNYQQLISIPMNGTIDLTTRGWPKNSSTNFHVIDEIVDIDAKNEQSVHLARNLSI